MPQVKGVLLDAWTTLLNERYGRQAVDQALTGLKDADRNLLSPHFLPSSWYPFDTLHSLRRLTRLLATPADGDLVVEIGRYMAQRACTGVYKSLVAKNPVKQAEKLPMVEELLFSGARTMEVEATSASSCLIRLRYQGDLKPTGAICTSHIGFYIRVFELAGAANVNCNHTKCAGGGDEFCEFLFTWEEQIGSRRMPDARS